MIRPFLGLTLACFLIGCGGSATDTSPATTGTDASTPDVAVAQGEPVEDGATAAAATTTSGTHTVVFKVPGMT